jgi:8-oxo-dGTP pyrophosphatase MutT (NUDIX family)
LNGNKILLKKATRGISKGKWNALGGKIDYNETPKENAIREVLEESGLKIKNPFYHGELRFFLNGKNELSWLGHLFSTKNFSGDIISTDEGELKWFDTSEIPFDKMWADDYYWIHLMMSGKKFDADFYFDESNQKIIKHEIRMK